MIFRSVIIGLMITGFFTAPAFAEVRELSRSELRENVRLGKSMALSRVLDVVNERIAGEVVDVRAFELDHVYFRVLVKRTDGKLGGIILNAETGQVMSSASSAAQEVMAASKSNKGKSGSVRRNGNANGNGNSNAGGNGGGNGGGKK